MKQDLHLFQQQDPLNIQRKLEQQQHLGCGLVQQHSVSLQQSHVADSVDLAGRDAVARGQAGCCAA